MKLRYKLWGLLTLVVSHASFAADGTESIKPYPGDNPLSSHLPLTDYSLSYLKQMFGDVGGMIHSNTAGFFGDFIIGDLFTVFNNWMLTFGVIVLGYIVFVGTLATANDGKAMGENGKSLWIPIRGATAMALLAPPIQGSGYCIAQKIVMFIVISGVAAANAMWEAAVNKLVSADTIKAVIEQQPSLSNGKLLTPVQAIFQQQVCRSAIRGHGNGNLQVQGAFVQKQNRVPHVAYDTAFFAVIEKKKKWVKWTERLAGAALASADPAAFVGVAAIDVTKNKLSKNDPGNEYQPICGGTWWTIPFINVPVVNVNTQKEDPYDNMYDDPQSQNAKNKVNRSLVLQENVKLQQKIIATVHVMYQGLEHAGAEFNDALYSDNTYKCSTSGLSGDEIKALNEMSPNGKRDTSVGEKYGCFVQAMQDYNTLVTYALVTAHEKELGQKAKDWVANPYVNITHDGAGLSTDTNHEGKNTGNQYVSDPSQFEKHYLSDGKGIDLTHAAQKLRDRIIAQGWANAGSYFYNIVELSTIGELSPVQLNVMPMYIVRKKDFKKMSDSQNGANEYLQHSYHRLSAYYSQELNAGTDSQDQVSARDREKGVFGMMRSRITYDFGDDQLGGTSRIIFDVLTLGMGMIVANWDRVMMTTVLTQTKTTAQSIGLVNPIIALQQLGKTELNEVADIWIQGMDVIGGITLGSTLLAAIPIVGKAGLAIGQGVNTMILWLQSIMAPIAILLFSSGFMLAIWLPFAPYVLSIFCVFGWLLSVIEMMIAAPIVALGILSPEGHDMFGKASPAVTLSLAIFLRPMLMVFGFIAGMVGIYIASSIVNAGFLHMVASVFHNHLGLLSGVGVITLYTLIMTSLSNKSFGLMTQISERVLRWIGGRDATFDQGEQQALGEVKSGMGDAGKATTDGVSQIQKPGNLDGLQNQLAKGASKGSDDEGGGGG